MLLLSNNDIIGSSDYSDCSSTKNAFDQYFVNNESPKYPYYESHSSLDYLKKEIIMGLIEFKKVSRIYRVGDHEQKALDNIDLNIEEGKFIVILGPSGAGKSTLLNLLGGLDSPTQGQILVEGKDISKLDNNALADYRASTVGFVFQSYNLIPTLTVFENVSLVKEIVKDPLSVNEMLNEVGLEDHKDKFPSELSGGEQQRVSIARAIAKNPKVLLCDEPTGALDSDTGVQILTMLQNLSREQKKTVIIVTHNSSIAEAADKVIRVKNGKIREVVINDSPKAISEVNW